MIETESWDTSYNRRAHFQESVVSQNLRTYVTEIPPRLQRHGSNAVKLRIWPTPLVDSKDNTMKVYVIAAHDDRADRSDRKSFAKAVGMIVNDMRQEFLLLDGAEGLMNVRDDLSCDKIMTLFSSTNVDNISLANCAVESEPSSGPPVSTDGPVKLRSAHSAISRLRHDPAHANFEYEVGYVIKGHKAHPQRHPEIHCVTVANPSPFSYVDRFKNTLVWMPLEMWGGRATEDEDFIPEHRIRQFKRSTDGTVIWDREKRLDLT